MWQERTAAGASAPVEGRSLRQAVAGLPGAGALPVVGKPEVDVVLLDEAYARITDLSGVGARMAISFDPLRFNFISSFDSVIVEQIIRKTAELALKPAVVVVGFIDDAGAWQWYQFESISFELKRTWLRLGLQHDLGLDVEQREPEADRGCFFNGSDLHDPVIRAFARTMATRAVTVSNLVGFLSGTFCILALNYDREVSQYDADVLNSIAVQSLFLKSLASQAKETENAYDYLVRVLARAAEANDVDTGNHILRVGEYSALLASELQLPERFIEAIRRQASLHDVGKLRVRVELLKKPSTLTPVEYEEIKQHTTYGATILGDHPRLAMARNGCLTHHENWDGSGYPHGLKGEQIPMEGRILGVADQYDALRNARVYKPAFGHHETCRVLTEGDGRTRPEHFDPRVLQAFQATAAQFEGVFNRMAD
jgi:HD-GYP domain-containing protein (c-di-GMP phosphodiesterase class II)